MLEHYCIYSSQLTGPVLQDMYTYRVRDLAAHLNRMRFWLDIDANAAHAVFYLKHSACIHSISHESDHQLGQ